MALQIERILDSRFEFSLDGGDPISDNSPNLTTFGNICHFKTRNGANIIANQNVTYAEVTVIDTYGGTGSFTFANVQNMWTKLIELNFFAGVSSGGGGGGVTRFDALLDTFTYFGNDAKVPVVNESQLLLEPTTFYNYNEFTQMDDVSIEALIAGKVVGVALVEGVLKFVLTDPIPESDQFVSAVGGFYYADLVTQTTPIAYTTGDEQLTNDIEGALTFLTQPPYGITSVWNESTNTFDFSQLAIGDEVFIRVDLIVTTSGVNQSSDIELLLAEATADVKTLLVGSVFTETAAATVFSNEIHFQISNENIRITAAKLLFSSDASADIEVTGFHVYIVRKSVNILDVTDNDFKTFSVAQLASPTVDVSTVTGTVKIGYEGVGNKITNVLFDSVFSQYLVGVDALLATKNVEIKIYNKTKKLLLSANVDSFTEPSTGYYNAVLAEFMDIADVAVNDSLEFNFDVSDLLGTGTVTSVAQSVPTGFTIGGSPITTAGTLAIDYDTGYEGFTSAQAALISSALQNVVEDTTPQSGGVYDTNSFMLQLSKGADVASANALAILQDGNSFNVTGTTTITSISTTGKVGTVIKLRFDDVLTLTHHATDLVLPTGANITTQVGDEAEFLEYASGDFRCTGYLRADGTALVGASGGGDVVGPASAFDENLTVFDLTTGKLIKDSGVNISAVNANTAKVSNVPTALSTGTVTDTTYGITSDGGADDVVLAQAVASTSSGVMSGTDKAKLDGIEAAADVTDATNVNAAGAVMEADYNANTILAATSSDTPVALTVAEQTLVGRITGGAIDSLTITQVKTLLVDRLEEDATVTGTKNIDWTAYETFRYTLTGACTFSDTNLPATGTKTITIHMSGNFAPTYPAGWTTYIRGTYDGAVRNLITVEYVKAGTPFFVVDISQPD